MALPDAYGLALGAMALGLVHGIEPGHGWPVAATYALDQSNKWLYGFAASFILGVGHLVSSIAMVGAFFWAKAYFSLTEVNEPITVLRDVPVAGLETVQVGGPVSLVAGVLLVALGVREYFHGHSHGHGGGSHDDHAHDHHADAAGTESDVRKFDHAHADAGGHGHADDHSHHDDGHSHDHHGDHGHAHADGGVLARLKGALPFVGGHSHDHGSMDEATDRGLWGIAGFAFLLGFAHEEEFEIIAICAGSEYCLELMTVYALTVIFGIVGLTMLLVAGYGRYEDRVERYAGYLPAFSAAVLVTMGLGFLLGLL